MLGPFATASRRTPIHQMSLLSHARIDVHDNDNAWQRGPLWPHGMGPIIPHSSNSFTEVVHASTIRRESDATVYINVTNLLVVSDGGRQELSQLLDVSVGRRLVVVTARKQWTCRVITVDRTSCTTTTTTLDSDFIIRTLFEDPDWHILYPFSSHHCNCLLAFCQVIINEYVMLCYITQDLQ